jgi:predicted amidohydrolase
MIAFAEHGADAGRGNLLGLQPCLSAEDYASAEALHAALDRLMQAARERGWVGARTVAVWPEYIGAWLAAAGEPPAVVQAPSLAAAMRRIALRQPLRLAGLLLAARERDRLAASLFRLKAAGMARDYNAVFGRLARDYAATTVAGSIVLPAPRVEAGRVAAGRGPLYNVSTVFAPDGRAHPRLARKAYPTTSEQAFIAAAPLDELPAFDTPAGRLAVLVCADSWRPEAYARLRALGAELVAVPSFIDRGGLWHRPWAGYDGAPAPPDVAAADVGGITEAQAWRKYALAGRLGACSARAGINVFLRGRLWDLEADGGCALALSAGQVTETGEAGAAVLNVWLQPAGEAPAM